MKKVISFIILFAIQASWMLQACDICEENQPKLLKGVTHGMGPQNLFDYTILWGSGVIVVITLIWSAKLLIKPKESSPKHIKNMILE